MRRTWKEKESTMRRKCWQQLVAARHTLCMAPLLSAGTFSSFFSFSSYLFLIFPPIFQFFPSYLIGFLTLCMAPLPSTGTFSSFSFFLTFPFFSFQLFITFSIFPLSTFSILFLKFNWIYHCAVSHYLWHLSNRKFCSLKNAVSFCPLYIFSH